MRLTDAVTHTTPTRNVLLNCCWWLELLLVKKTFNYTLYLKEILKNMRLHELDC